MSVFREYEKKIVRMLVTGLLSPDQVETLIREGELVNYDYTGCGYFLTVKHPILPTKRVVCDTPKLSGSVDGIICGFVIFVQNGELILECHSWGEVDVPDWFRSRNAEVAPI